MELTSNEAVKQAVIAGLGCSIMPLIGIKEIGVAIKTGIIPFRITYYHNLEYYLV
jgi:DNA-binding transcriptional LysR family regulator